MPIAEASATAEPEMPANIMEESTFTCARPPRICPTKDCAKRTMTAVMPPAFMSSPARMKNGTANRGKLSMPL